MPSERSIALKQALQIAPIDPMGPHGPVIPQAQTEISRWKKSGTIFTSKYDILTEGLNKKEKEALNLYLWTSAITISRHVLPPTIEPSLKSKWKIERKVGKTLFSFLTDAKTKSEEDAMTKTWEKYVKSPFNVEEISQKSIKTQKETPYEKTDEKIQHLGSFLFEKIKRFEEKLKKANRAPEIREYLEILDEARKFCDLSKITKGLLADFIIGNINLHPYLVDLEPEYQDIPEKMGLSGNKKRAIEERMLSYREMLIRSGVNYFGYQGLGLGWQGLRQRHEKYLNRFNLNNYQHNGELDGSFLSYGATNGIERAYLIARYSLQEELKNPKFNPKILFPTPGFTVLAKLPETALKFPVLEQVTQIQENFFLNPEKLKKYLEAHKDIMIIDLSFLNNPTSKLISPQQLKKVIKVISEHRGINDKRLIVINDAAYLGMGDENKFKKLGEIINKYKRRFDVLPMSKIFARPGLRGGDVSTPDKKLARNIPAITKLFSPSMSYSMMFEALAIWDYVKYKDQKRLFELFNERQKRFMDALSVRDDVFDMNSAFFAKDIAEKDIAEKENSKMEDLAGFYLYVPIKKGVNPLYVPAMTGLFGNLDDTFYINQKRKGQKFIRFALGMEPLSLDRIEKLKENLIRWKKLVPLVYKT